MSSNLKTHIVKDHLKRFTEKNKTIQLVREVETPREEIRKKTAPNHQILHWNPPSNQQETKKFNENKFYKGILSAQNEQDSIGAQRKTSPVYTTSQSFFPYNTKYSSPKTLFNQQSNEKLSQMTEFYTTSYQNFSSSKKELYKLNSDKFSSTSQLQIWKQLEKSYKKNRNLNAKIEKQTKIKKSQISMKVKHFLDLQKEKATNQLINGKNRAQQDTESKIVEQFLQKYGKKYLNEAKIKQEKQQNDLESKMILGRSFSFDKFQKLKIKYNRNLIKKVTENSKSQKFNGQSSILLLHNEPLEHCIEQYFVPIKKEIQARNETEPPSRQQQIRIKSKSKKLTYRSVEHLKRIKKSLFKQRSEKEISNKECKTAMVQRVYSKENEGTVFSTQKPSQRQSAKEKKCSQRQSAKDKKGSQRQQVNQKNPSQRQSIKSKNPSQKQLVKSRQPQFHKKTKVLINKIPLSQSMKKSVYLEEIPQLIHHNITSSTYDNASGMLSPTYLETPKQPQITPTSSVISFGEEQLNQKIKQAKKSEPYFNAW